MSLVLHRAKEKLLQPAPERGAADKRNKLTESRLMKLISCLDHSTLTETVCLQFTGGSDTRHTQRSVLSALWRSSTPTYHTDLLSLRGGHGYFSFIKELKQQHHDVFHLWAVTVAHVIHNNNA